MTSVSEAKDKNTDISQEERDLLVDVYEQVAPYLVSDCSVNAISGMLSRYEGYMLQEIVTPRAKTFWSRNTMNSTPTRKSWTS